MSENQETKCPFELPVRVIVEMGIWRVIDAKGFPISYTFGKEELAQWLADTINNYAALVVERDKVQERVKKLEEALRRVRAILEQDGTQKGLVLGIGDALLAAGPEKETPKSVEPIPQNDRELTEAERGMVQMGFTRAAGEAKKET